MLAMMKTLILISCIGTLFAGFLILFRPVTKRIFSSNWHYYMWLAVLITMLLPFKFTAPTPRPAVSVDVEHIFTQDDGAIATEAEGVAAENDVAVIEGTIPVFENETNTFVKADFTYFFYIWVIGFAVILFVKIISYIAFLLKIRSKSQLISCPEIKNYTKRTVITRVSDDICSPLMVGIFKPVLLLPNASLTDEQLHYILEHETTHLKRYDILYKWFLSLVKAIHWFNPVIYIISRYINLDCEISCDMAVLKNLDTTQTDGYVSTILSLLSAKNKTQIPLTTGMTGNKKILKKRFISIKKNAKIGKAAKIVSFVLAFSIIVGAIYVSGLINGRISSHNDMLLDIKTDERQGNSFNFLMIGVDESEKADTILGFNFDGKTLTCMVVPRNIAISEYGGTKTISQLLGEENGDQKVVDVLKGTLGIPIHYYAKVRMDVIADVVDYVGGIEFDVPYNMVYDDPAQDLHIDLKEGKQVLNGKQVEHLLRFRDRIHPNGDEVRVMTWHSVIKQFLDQAVIGNKIGNLPDLYKIATKNIKTNYPLDALTKDFNHLKNINRNNIVIENIRGRNVALDGYFVFHINYVESEPILEVFNSVSEGTNLISAITYTNDIMGFEIKVPEQWKGKYEVIQFDNQVAFLHKDIFLKYGKGAGALFRISKIEPPTEEKLKEIGEPSEYLYWGKHFAYVWSVASDVQYPIWDDSDEEDAELASDYKDMMTDLNFIKESFNLIVNQQKAAADTNTKKTSYNSRSEKTSDVSNEKNIKIKSSIVSDEEYSGFAHLEIENINSEELQNELNKQGVTKVTSNSGDLSSNYIVGEYSYKNNLKDTLENITSDNNGNISVYFDVNTDNLVGISFYDAETKNDVGSYEILANNKNAYTFLGFNPDKEYVIDIQGKTQGTWKVEGEYIIY